MPLLTLLTGPFGRVAGIAALAVGLLAAGAMALHQHDARVLAEQATAAEAAQLAGLRADHVRTVAALEAQAADAAARADRLAKIRSAVDAAPPTNACATSPAVRAAVDGLRQQPPGHR